MKTGKWRIGGFLLALVLLVGAVAGTAYATTDTQTGSPMATLCQNFVAKLAANLGIDEDTLTTALDTTKQQMLDEAVQQGKLTQEQADKMAARKDGGFFGFGFKEGKMGHKGGMGNQNIDGIASILGITSDELKTELESGKKMQDIVTEHGLTMDQFKEKMQEQREAEIAQDVADGKITQEQADNMLQNKGQHFKRFNINKVESE